MEFRIDPDHEISYRIRLAKKLFERCRRGFSTRRL